MHLFEDGAWLRTLPISTGTPEFYTPAFEGTVRFYLPTIYSVDGLSADHAWYLFYNAGRIYIHGAPYTLGVNGEKLYEGLEFLGVTPSSHGCIRVHPDDAAWLTEWNPGGAVIHITQPRR
jgi:lipoprotein-anchoring transpeptidase ErfK/SrfK